MQTRLLEARSHSLRCQVNPQHAGRCSAVGTTEALVLIKGIGKKRLHGSPHAHTLPGADQVQDRAAPLSVCRGHTYPGNNTGDVHCWFRRAGKQMGKRGFNE